MITKDIMFELPDVLSEPKVIKNFFTNEMLERVKQIVNNTGMGTDALQFHTMLARWEASIDFDDDIEEYCLNKAREIFKDNTLQKAYFYAVRYQFKDGCVPHLWEHTDQNGTQTTIDITIENTANWGLIVEEQHFDQNPNDAIIFCGQQHIHSRPPYPTTDPDKYTTVLFLHFTQPDHWIQKDKAGIYKFGKDGDVRFFNRNRFLALPDGPVNQPVCACHDYSHTLDLYNEIVGFTLNQEPELAEVKIQAKQELAPGIMLYKTGKESARTLKGLIQNAMFKQWEAAEVLVDGKPTVQYDARNCFNYFLTDKQNDCHPQDPIVRTKKSLELGIDAIVEDYRGRYSITPLVSHHTVLLRYEPGNMFHNHYDAAPIYPRVVSVSMFLNDNFEGGELEFKEFNLKIKPEAGDVVVFCSGFPYMHQVHAVTKGIRYAAVKWYEFIR
jgi:alkylated DNA repair dioxygenase AlkB